MKGFLGGVSIGALVAVGGAAMWSLSTPLPEHVQVDTSAADPSSQPAVAEAQPPEPNERRDADLVEVVPSSPSGSGDAEASPVAVLDASPGNRPVVATAEGAGAGDLTQGGATTLPQASEAVSVGTESTPAPNVPGQEDTPIVSTETAAMPATPVEVAPQPEVADTAPEDEVDRVVTETAAEGGESTETAEVTQTEVPSAPQVTVPVTPALSGSDIGSAPAPSILPSLSASPTAAAQTGGDSAAQPSEERAQQENAVAVPSTAVDPAETEAGEEQRAAAEVNTSARLGTRVVPLTERSSTPTLLGNSSETPEQGDTGLDPFEANAEAFAVLDDRPLMSIVLIDDAAAIGAEALEEFPYPLTFAISPDDPRATEKMQARRDAGFEVMILADLPREANPQDAETAMAVWLQQMPLAVGVLEGVETGFQGNRPLADQMVSVMQAAGLGMVTQNAGLNTVQKLALRDGMPAGLVFRDFDGAGQNPRAIRRFLDQAAFRARQEGAVIMLGRLRPDTISALLLWGLQDRASQVGLAPVSAGLKAALSRAE
jgi:polysaccharide deacetylase 2 family uncharacterized protein YibQ